VSTAVSQILLLIIGLGLVFFGLPLFRGALNIFGFIVGVVYGAAVYELVAPGLGFTPVIFYVLGAVVALAGGLLGTLLANFAQALFVFIAGGLIALMVEKMLAGASMGEAVSNLQPGWFQTILHLSPVDIVWFVVGGIIFVLAIDTVMILALVALGTALIYRALDPLDLLRPEWIIPVIVGVLGLFVQESIRNRAHREKRLVITEPSPPRRD
jgi:hypothetical protein